MKKIVFICAALCPVFFLSCNQSDQNTPGSKEAIYQAINDSAGSYGLDSINSTKRKMIHTADISCRANDVLKVTTTLESLTKKLSGIIEETNLQNETIETKELPYKSDSLQQVTTYRTTASLRLRVPVVYRDSLINSIPALVNFIENRRLVQTDATINYIANEIIADAGLDLQKKSEDLATKSKDLVAVEQSREASINKLVENLKINDQADFATVTVYLYQPAQANIIVVADTDAALVTAYPTAMGEAFVTGFGILKKLLIAVISIWPFILFGVLIFLFRKKWTPKIRLAEKI